MTTHTPGPWSIKNLEEARHGYADWQTFAIHGPENIRLAVVGEVDHYKSERIPHNARLIAAAPELLEALQHALAECSMSEPLFTQACSAVAKARGDA